MHLLLLLFLVTSSACYYSSSADDPLLINHKHRRRSIADEDPRSLNFSFVLEPSNTIVSPDGSALLHCKFQIASLLLPTSSNSELNEESDEDEPFSREIVTRVEWRKDGSPVHPVGRTKLLSNGSLWLETVVPADEGQYQCAVRVITRVDQGREITWVYLSHRASLSLPSLHRFEQHPTDQHVRIGQMAAFRCLLDSKPSAWVEWYHDNQLLKPGEDGYTVLPVSQTLEIVNVHSNHAGVYKCVARNGDRSRTSQLGTLTVLEGEESPQSMSWVLEPRNQLVTQGDSVLLECLANNGGPRQTTKVQWMHNSKMVEKDDPKFELVGKRRTHLLVRNVTGKEAGKYTCRAESQWRTQDVEATVAVRVPPTISTRPTDVLTQETNDVEFDCVADGLPAPRITWYKNGEVIIPSEYFVIASNKLRVFGLVRDDQGVYQCIADNEVGSDQAAAQLLVDQAASHLPLISAPSDDSNSMSLTDSQTPPEPLSLRSTEIKSQNIQLAWDPPLNLKHGPISNYIVYYREQGSSRERSVNTTSTTATLNDLQPMTAYSVRVIAVNSAGPGKASDAVVITTKKQESLPGKVRNLQAHVLSSESIQVNWDEPEPVDGSSNSDLRYKLFYSKWTEKGGIEEEEDDEHEDSEEDDEDEEEEEGEDEEEETQVLMIKTSYTLHGMAKNSRYAIRVEAENQHGAGPSSEPLLVQTWPDVPSASPQNMQLESLRSGRIRVRWRAPPKDQWNGPLTGYKLRYKPKGRQGQAKASTVIVDGAATETHVLEGLEAGAPVYMVRMAAVNQNGTGPWTDWSEIEMEEEEKEETQLAGAPSELRVHATHDSVTASWLPPADDNVLIRGYLIGWGINVPDVDKASVDAEARKFTIRGLKPNREYVISLRAFNRVGHGFPIYETIKTSSFGHAASPSANAKPIPGFDLQSGNSLTPVGVVAETVSASQIRLSWVDPNEQAFNQLYTIKYGQSLSEGQGQQPQEQYKLLNTSETEHTFDGLKPDTPYEFAVKLAESVQWSLNAANRTMPAAPSSPPRDLTITGERSDETGFGTAMLSWQPPKYANGVIQEYIVLYSDRADVPERDWVMDSVKGDRLSMLVRKLQPGLAYHFKLQARNTKGYGPFSSVVSFRTATDRNSVIGGGGGGGRISDSNGSTVEAGGIEHIVQLISSNLAFVLIGIVVAVLLLLAVALTALCTRKGDNNRAASSNRRSRRQKQQNNNNRRSKQPYIQGRQLSATPPPPPMTIDGGDLWIHQQNGDGGGRFAALVNSSAEMDYDMSMNGAAGGTGILLIDGQQRAFIAPQQTMVESPTLPRYQQQQQPYHAGSTPRQQRQVNSVGTLPRNYHNHHHHHNSANSLEMKTVPAPPMHIYNGQQQQQQQMTPSTPRNPHVVYTRVDRQPIAKVDFTIEKQQHEPPAVQHHYQQQMLSGNSATPPPPGQSNNEHNTNRHSNNDGYQTVRGAVGPMRSFIKGDGAGAVPGEQPPSQHQGQQRMAHIVRPIVYSSAGNGSSPSPSTLRNAVGQPQQQQQKKTPIIGQKFNGARVPVGRATAQPRVNLAAATVANSSSVAAATDVAYGCSPYAGVHSSNGSGKMGQQESGAGVEYQQQTEYKSIGSTEDLQEIDQMIETLQQLQQDFTDNAAGNNSNNPQ